MPKPAKKEEIQGRYFRWLMGQRNGVYFADGRSNQPSLGRQSLGTRDKSEALLAIEQLDLTMAVRQGLADAGLLKTEAHQILAWAEGRKLYECFVKRPLISGGPRPSTAKRYRAVLDKFIPFAEGQGRRTWNEMNRQLLDEYAGWLDGEAYAYAAEDLELTTLKQILKFLIENQHIPSSIAFSDNHMTVKRKEPAGVDTRWMDNGHSQIKASTECWDTLTEEFPNDVRLQQPVVYSLPVRLLDSLHKHVPKLLTDGDQKFERRLRELAGTGFRHQRPFGCELLGPPNSSEVRAELFGDLREQVRRFADRLQGFAGWLVTNPIFRSEVASLAERWNQWPCLVSTLPNRHVLDRSPPRGNTGLELKRKSNLFADACNFLNRWNLVRMDTWDLPIPLPPVQLTNAPLPTNDLHSTGVSIFIPWSLLVDRDLKVGEILQYHQSRQDLSHLDGWTSSGPTNSWVSSGMPNYSRYSCISNSRSSSVSPIDFAETFTSWIQHFASSGDRRLLMTKPSRWGLKRRERFEKNSNAVWQQSHEWTRHGRRDVVPWAVKYY